MDFKKYVNDKPCPKRIIAEKPNMYNAIRLQNTNDKKD